MSDLIRREDAIKADDGIRPSAMDYCSYGERREDGEEE